MKVAITGATGFVGTRLMERLHAEGHAVLVLTRNPSRAQRLFPATQFPKVEVLLYDPTTSGDWQSAIAHCDGVVNLAGEPIAESRWTPERKQMLINSRQLTTQKLVEAIASARTQNSGDATKPTVLVNASAIGYYGTSETATFEETSAPGTDFLAEICQAWETEATAVKATGTRLVILRLGIVLGQGGALGKLLTPFKLFAGGPIGSGRQWFSWIHRDDLVDLILYALTHAEMSGVYNATAPQPVRMAELATTLGQVMNRPSWIPVPGFALEAMLGDGAIVVLEGQEVLPKRTLAAGFQYQYPTVKPALADIVGTIAG